MQEHCDVWSGHPALNSIIPDCTAEESKFAIAHFDFSKLWSAASKFFTGIQRSYYKKRSDPGRPDIRGLLIAYLIHCPCDRNEKQLIFDDLCTMVVRHMDIKKHKNFVKEWVA